MHTYSDPPTKAETEMARRGPLSAAKRKREADKREKRQAKQEKRARRAEEKAQARQVAQSETPAQEEHERLD
jgi:hypothetical protein